MGANTTLLKTQYWIGFITYTILALLYANYLRTNMIFNINKIIPITGFVLLSIYSIRNALYVNNISNDPKTNTNTKTKYIDYINNIGLGLLALYFCLIFGKSNHFFYICAPIGYMFLASKQTIGLYPLIVFYSISIGYHIFDFANTDYLVMMTKILMLIYFGIYRYIEIQKNNYY